METEVLRFKFIPPSEKEIQLDNLLGKILWIVLPAYFLGMVLYSLLESILWFKVAFYITLVLAIAITIYRENISRTAIRFEQSRNGFIDLTPAELRISRSFHSLLRIEWPYLEKIEVKKTKLRLSYQEAAAHQIDKQFSMPLHSIPLKDVENSEALIAELEKRLQLQGKSGDVLANCQTNSTFIP